MQTFFIMGVMIESLPTIQVIVGVISIISSFILCTKYLLNRFEKKLESRVNDAITNNETISKLNYEFSRNGGYSTIKDQVTRIYESIVKVESRQDLQLSHNPMPTFECDSVGKCVRTNQAMIDLFGAKNKHELVGHGWMNFITTDFKINVEDTFNDAISSGQLELVMAFPIRNRANGSEFFVELNINIKRKKTEPYEPIIMQGAIIKKEQTL